MLLSILCLAGAGLTSFVTAGTSFESRTEFSDSVDEFLGSVNIAPDIVSVEAKAHRGAALACAILEAANPAALVSKTDGALYINVTQAHNSQTAWEHPRCIWTPSDTKGVSLALKVASKVESQFAIRSGGHSPFAGFASINNGGFLISLSDIKDLDYDPETETQRSGFGNLWGDVYEYLVQFNRIVVGGRGNSVGLALTLGGGLSHSSNEHGWAVQNIVSYELVLADGSIVTASAGQREDLFTALKGGQNNFGIVTHVTQTTYPSGKVWGGIIVYPGSTWEQFMSAMADYQLNGQLDTKSATLPYLFFNSDIIVQQLVYFDEVEKPEAFSAFYNITFSQDRTQIWDSFSAMISSPLGYGLTRYSYATTTIYLDKKTYIGATEIVRNFTTRASLIPGGDLIIMPQPISSSMISASNVPSPDPLSTTDKPQMWFAVSMGWANEDDDERAEALMLDVLEAVETYTKSRGMYDPFIFTNDAYPSQAALESYGSEMFSGMLAAQEQYDPTRVFQKLVPGGFKLS